MARTDIDFSFKMHPLTGDIALKKGSSALRQSIINLVLTNYYERGFNVEVAANLSGSLFENITLLSTQQIRDNISNVLTNFEPQAELIDVEVVDDNNNGLDVKIFYHEFNNPVEQVVTIALSKLR